MSFATCNTLGNISNAAGLAGVIFQGALGAAVAYQKKGSPYTILQETWNMLRDIQTHLSAITTERRDKIEAAAKNSQCRSLADIEGEFRDLWDAHTTLRQEYEQSSIIERHFPGDLRTMIKNLKVEVKTLLNDTWTTTRAAQAFTFPPPPPGDQSNSTDLTPANRVTSPTSPLVNRASIEMVVV